MERHGDQQTSKFRTAPPANKVTQEKLWQMSQKSEESKKSGKGVTVIDSIPASIRVTTDRHDGSMVNPDILRQQLLAGGQQRPLSVSPDRQPVTVHDRKGSNLALPMRIKEHLAAAASRDKVPSPSKDQAVSHTTKSSSLSRDISPSRITAQVVSAMSESAQQTLLFSALTGQMSAPSLIGTVGRQDTQHDARLLGNRLLEVSGHQSSSQGADFRRSPLQSENRPQTERKDAVLQMGKPGYPFEHLARAIASKELSTAINSRDRSLGNKDVALSNNVVLSGSKRRSPGPSHHLPGYSTSSGNQQQMEAQVRTPSPKPVAKTHSPQQQVNHPIQRRSPVSPASRVSPSKSLQEKVPTLSVGLATAEGQTVQIPMPPFELLSQHLLAGAMVTTSISNSVNSQPARSPLPTLTSRLVQLPPVSVTLTGHSSSQLSTKLPVKPSTIPVGSSQTLSRKVPSVSGFGHHAISVGTETEAKQFSSHGAQTKPVPSVAVSVENVSGSILPQVFQFKSVVSKGANSTSSDNVKEVDSRSENAGMSQIAVQNSLAQGTSDSLLRVSPISSGSMLVMNASDLGNSGVPGQLVDLPGSISIVSSSVSDFGKGNQLSNAERKRYSPSPTPAHGNTPIPVPSNHMHAHTHLHFPHPNPKAPITTAQVGGEGLAAAATVAPLLQPVVSLCRLSTSTMQPLAVRVKPETKTVSSVTSVSHSSHYQPHYHHQQPVQTVTSQTSETGPVVKDFIPVTGSPEPPVYHKPPLPHHINPFTFTTRAEKISSLNGDSTEYSFSYTKDLGNDSSVVHKLKNAHTLDKSVSEVSGLRQQNGKDDIPRLIQGSLLSATCQSIENKGKCLNGRTTLNHSDPSQSNQNMPNPFNMRLQNLSNFPLATNIYRSAYRSHSVAVQRAKAGSITSAAKSLDLLRQNIQKSINKELDQVVQRYVEKFFHPAAANIRLNNGSNAVSEEHIHAVCKQIFEEAKKMYTSEARRSATPIVDVPDHVSEPISITDKRISPLLKKHKVSDSESEKGSDSGIPKKIPKRKGRPPLHASGRSTPLKLIRSDQVKREGPKWDPERIKSDTLFVMGARANKALGLGNTRGRLYIRHPDIFKYSGDQDDKVWLHEQKLMPATGGKAYMLLVEDIIDLSKTEEYRESPTLMMHECRGFRIPEWMLVKVKEQMQALRSDRGKRSRSHSPGPLSERPDPPRSLPFSTLYDTASNNDGDSNKNSLQPSPTDTEEMEFLSAADNDDTQPSDISPFNVASGLDDAASPSSCHLDPVEEEPQVASTPFT